MKCINCKKETVDGYIYCSHCGEKLSDVNNIDGECNYNVDNQKVYEEVGDKVNEYGTSVKENLPIYYNKFKAIVSQNKIASAIGAFTILALILGIGIFSFMQGRPLDQSKLQTYLVGQNLMVNGTPYEIKPDQIKSFEITSRKSEKKKTDEIEGSITIDLDNATISANVEFMLFYNSKDKDWQFNGLISSDVKNIEPKVDLNNSIKDLLKDAKISYNYKNIDLKNGLLKDIENINVNGTGLKREGSATLALSNGVVESTVSANFAAHFDLKEGKWILNSNTLNSKIVGKEKISTNLNDEDKKKFILSAFENDRSYPYKYKSGESEVSEDIILNKDNISDLKINNFMEYDEKTIRAEIEGQASSGDVDKIKFSGVVYLDLSLSTSSYSNKFEVNVDSLELTAMNLDAIKKSLLQFKLDSKQITVAIADTFNLGNENKDSKMFEKVYEGTITIDGTAQNIKTEIKINYNQKNKKYEWKLSSIDVIK